MIWHILKKDLRRLFFPWCLTATLLAALSLLDAWRYDFEAGLAETVLNVLLPLAWSALIALAVQLEPLTSDTAFWLTRPYRRSSLLASKLLFAVLAVHLPVLLMHAFVLISHGFSPWASVLLWKQLLILLAVTVPSLAIASFTATLASFAWCVLAAGSVAVLLEAALQGVRYPWMLSDWVPAALALGLVGFGGCGILLLQYRRRTRSIARTLGFGLALSAVLVFSFVPRDLTEAMQCAATSGLPRAVAVEYAPGRTVAPAPVFVGHPNRVALAVPVKVTGVEADLVYMEQLAIRMSGVDGRTWSTRRDPGQERRAHLALEPGAVTARQWMVPDRDFVAGARGPVRIEASATVRPFSHGDSIALPALFPQSDVPGVGRCSSFMTQAEFGRRMLKVTCESPEPLSPVIQVKLVANEGKRDWPQDLGDSYNARVLPALHWLSPLHRKQTHFQITETESDHPASRWLVPHHLLSGARIHIRPAIEQGCAKVDYAMEVADLRSFVVPSGPGSLSSGRP